MPIALADDERAAVMAAAGPLSPSDRDPFPRAIAAELKANPQARIDEVAMAIQRRLAGAPQRHDDDYGDLKANFG